MRLLALLISVAACSTDDANVTGDYNVNLTNRDNGCNFMNWTVGDSAAAMVTFGQNGSAVTATATGVGALILDVVLGGHVFSGRISGNSLDLTLFGTRSNTSGNCTYTFHAEIHAAVDGDVMTGQLDYAAATNANPDCAGITNCRSFQDFNGTRPPR